MQAALAFVDAMPARKSSWFLYLVRTKDGALYTGITVDVERRLAQHAAGRGAKALRGRGPLQLVFARCIGSLAAALRLERRVKLLDKAGKERLVVRGLPRGWLTAARGTTGMAAGRTKSRRSP